MQKHLCIQMHITLFACIKKCHFSITVWIWLKNKRLNRYTYGNVTSFFSLLAPPCNLLLSTSTITNTAISQSNLSLQRKKRNPLWLLFLGCRASTQVGSHNLNLEQMNCFLFLSKPCVGIVWCNHLFSIGLALSGLGTFCSKQSGWFFSNCKSRQKDEPSVGPVKVWRKF